MSNYLVAVLHERHRAALERWLRVYGDPREQQLTPLDDQWWRLLVSSALGESLTEAGWFRGNAVTETEISFGRRPSAGLDRATGTFVDIEFTPEGALVRRDLSGRFALLTTRAEGFAAASDSLLLLAALRRALELPVTANEHCLLAYGVPGFDTTQAIASDTFLGEIAAVAAYQAVELTHDRIALHDSGFKARTEPVADAVATAREGAAEVASIVAGLATLPEPLQLSLSGGYDSRSILGAALATGSDIHLFTAHDAPTQEADFVAARGVAEHYALPFNDLTSSALPTDQEHSLAVFGTFCAGTYYRLGIATLAAEAPGRIQLDGLTSYLEQGRWRGQSWQAFAEDALTKSKFGPEHPVADAFVALGMRGLREHGFDPDDPDGETWLRFGYCVGIHGAIVQIARNLGFFAPLDRPLLLQASCTARGTLSSLDLCLLFDPVLAQLPFDTPERGYSAAEAEARLVALGGPLQLDPDRRHRIVGSPSDLRVGPSALSLAVAEHWGFTGDDESAAIDWYHGGDRDLLPFNLLREVYDEVHANGLWMLGRNGALAASGNSLAKAASLRLLRLVTA